MAVDGHPLRLVGVDDVLEPSIFLRTILGFDDPLSLTPDYCGISRVRASSNGIRSVRSINETHHVRDLIEW